LAFGSLGTPAARAEDHGRARPPKHSPRDGWKVPGSAQRTTESGHRQAASRQIIGRLPLASGVPLYEAASSFRTPDVAPHFLPGGENGLSHSFRWRELRRWGRRCRLPARAELGPLLESDRAKASTACPTCGLTANSTTSGVLRLAWLLMGFTALAAGTAGSEPVEPHSGGCADLAGGPAPGNRRLGNQVPGENGPSSSAAGRRHTYYRAAHLAKKASDANSSSSRVSA
jgi:hypothetical protein